MPLDFKNNVGPYKCSKMRCTGKMAPPDENLLNAHSQHRQNFSSGPGTSNFWTSRASNKSWIIRPLFLQCISSVEKHNKALLKLSLIKLRRRRRKRAYRKILFELNRLLTECGKQNFWASPGEEDLRRRGSRQII